MGQTTFSGPVKSDNGFIENSFTTAERNAIPSPTAGLLIYNTETNTYEVYNGSGWQDAFAPPVQSFDWNRSANFTEATLTNVAPNTFYYDVDLSGFTGNIQTLLEIPSGTTISILQYNAGPTVYTATLNEQFYWEPIAFGGSGGYRSIVVATGGVSGNPFFVGEMFWDQAPYVPALPTVDSITPSNGSTNGGTHVVISGTNFTTTTDVKIGGTSVTSFQIISDTTINAVTAAHTAATASVNVFNSVGTNASNSLYTYEAGPTTFGVSSWPSTYLISNCSPSPSSIRVYGSDPAMLAALAALPIGAVLTVTHGTMIGIGDTFTLTAQFNNAGDISIASCTYSGGGFAQGMAAIGQFSVS